MRNNILMVDDDRLLREVMRELLQDFEEELVSTEDYENAVELVRGHKFKLALLGHGIGNRNAIKLMRKLQRIDPELFCLIMTGFRGLESVSAAVKKGCSDYILKPFKLEELVNVLKRHL
ncbi:MAG: response regulator [Candidatus Cloacimonetes bacterium]|nr:response regulator [Candidatus Cloacimonadota bacterium]